MAFLVFSVAFFILFGFVGAAFLVENLTGSLLAFLIIIPGLVLSPLWLFPWFLGWFAVRMRCPHCGKDIPSNYPWQCGYCDTEHEIIFWNSIFSSCRRCHRNVPGYFCHHCDGEIILIEGVRDPISAYPLGCPPEEYDDEPEVDPHQEYLRQGTLEQERLEQQIKTAQLDAELAKKRAELEALTRLQKPARARLEEELANFLASHIGAEETADRYLERIRIEWRHDPVKIKRYEMAIKRWKIDHL